MQSRFRIIFRFGLPCNFFFFLCLLICFGFTPNFCRLLSLLLRLSLSLCLSRSLSPCFSFSFLLFFRLFLLPRFHFCLCLGFRLCLCFALGVRFIAFACQSI